MKSLARSIGLVALAIGGVTAPMFTTVAHAMNMVRDNSVINVVPTCTTTNGSNTLTTVGNGFAGIQVGDLICGAGIAFNATVAAKVDNNTITMSAPASASGTASMTFNKLNVTYRINLWAAPIVCGPFAGALNVGNAFAVFNWCAGAVPNNAVAVARYDPCTQVIANPVWVFGNAAAGPENQIETLPDSLVAGVGLYTPGGASNPPPDSTIRVRIQRSGTQVTLTIPSINVGGVLVGSGGLQVRAFNSNEVSISEFRLIVYETAAAADADIAKEGTGATFYGEVRLTAQNGIPTVASYTGSGLSSADFIPLQVQAGSKYTLRPIATFSKVVNVPDANAAVVVAVSNPRVSTPVPSSTSLGMTLLALALMGSGLWVMRSRRRVEAA